MPHRVIPIRSRKAERGLRFQAMSHGLAGLLLLLAGVESFRAAEGSLLLGVFELLAGTLLLLMVVLELRGGHRAHPSGPNWVGLFAGLALFAEGLKLAHEGRHSVQYCYYATALLTALVGAFFPRIRHLRRLELTSTGLFLRRSWFRTLRLAWNKIAGHEISEDSITLITNKGDRRRIDLRDMVNAEEVRSALVEALEGRAASWVAITRGVSPRISACELSYAERRPIDPSLAAAQHRAYEECLASLGFRLQRLPAEPDLPDSVFIEDTALVLDEVAVIAHPGAESRRPERTAVIQALRPYRRLVSITPPGTLDGGDVLRVGRRIFVGSSERSNEAGRRQLRSLLAPLGYDVTDVAVRGCLHLKSAVTQVAENTLLIQPLWVDRSSFAGMDFIEVDPEEPDGANALFVRGVVLYPAAFPATRKRLEERGIEVKTVEVSELRKAEGGVTCCSLLLTAPGAAPGSERTEEPTP